MTIKIKAPRAHYYPLHEQAIVALKGGSHRIVHESDWRKLMRLVRVVDEHTHADPWKTCDICEALVALSKEKKK